MNKLLKLSIAGLALTGAASYGQIEINENLSVTGFIDMSSTFGTGDTTYSLDQAEIDFLYTYGDLSAQVDLDNTQDSGFDVEQAFITYDFGSGSSLRAGKFLSYMGWETAEPTGLYQFSYAYGSTIPGYQDGIAYDYSADWGSFGISLLDSVYNADDEISTSAGGGQYGIETKIVLTPTEGLTLFLGYALDAMDVGDDAELINFWTSYEWDISTVAFEYNMYSDGDDIDQFLLMYSAAISDAGTITARYSQQFAPLETDDFTKATLAYLHAVNDNLTLVFEYSLTDYEIGGEANEFAIEALFTF